MRVEQNFSRSGEFKKRRSDCAGTALTKYDLPAALHLTNPELRDFVNG